MFNSNEIIVYSQLFSNYLKDLLINLFSMIIGYFIISFKKKGRYAQIRSN